MFKVGVRPLFQSLNKRRLKMKQVQNNLFFCNGSWDLCFVKGNILLSPWERCAAIRNPYIFFSCGEKQLKGF